MSILDRLCKLDLKLAKLDPSQYIDNPYEGEGYADISLDVLLNEGKNLISSGLIPRRLGREVDCVDERIHPQESQCDNIVVPLGFSGEVSTGGV